MVFPKSNFEPNSKGEDYVWNQFKKILPPNYVSFHNYEIETQQADVIVLVPDAGVLIIEIKGFYPENVEFVQDNTNIFLKNGNVERSPYKQCKRYRDRLIDLLIEKHGELANHIVAISICFPYFSESDIEEKQLTRLADKQLIIGKADLQSWDKLSAKFIKIFEKTNQIWIPNVENNCFTKKDMAQVANIFMPGFEFDPAEKIEEDENSIDSLEYSVFVTRKEKDKELVSSLFEKWKCGTKIFFFSKSSDDCYWLKTSALEYIKVYSLEKDLISSNGDIFNMTVEYIDTVDKDIIIYNGDNLANYYSEISRIGEVAYFNAEQYRAEHVAKEDMVVRAGAGTGKTYLLVSRIAYLCWKHQYSADELKNRIILITFTNDATDEMRARLVLYFSNMFKLTYCKRYFEYAEIVENMVISTIDSFGKRMISKFAFYLGLGVDVSVTNGTMIKRDVLHQLINQYAKENELVSSSYYIEKFLRQIIEKLGNRSVDALDVQKEFNTACANEPVLGKLIQQIPEAMRMIEETTESRNQIPMSHIIVYLKRIVSMIKQGKIEIRENEQIDYLFIDEFQDTDDTQIELVADFKRLYGFKLFVVGDPKQSIYRFRGSSDDKAFDILNEQVGYKIREYPLVKNYRTNVKLLDYMHLAFANLAEKKELLKYEKKDRLVGVKNPDEPKRIIKYEISTEEEREYAVIEALNEFRRHKKEESKMAILVRSNAEVKAIKELCYKHNIVDVDIDTGGKLYQSEAVIDLYKLLLALQNPGEVSFLFNIFTTSYSNRSLKKIELKNSGNPAKYFKDNLPESLSNWDGYLSMVQKEPILKVLRTITEEVKPWQICSQRTVGDEDVKKLYGERYKNNLDKLFEKITIENNSSYLTLSSVLDFLRIMITTKQEEDEREIESTLPIQCRTVHRAKGKEYDTVFFPFADERIRKEKINRQKENDYNEMDFVYSAGNIGYTFKTSEMMEPVCNEFYNDLIDAELKDQSYEEARIFYVALTRAKSCVMYVKNLEKQKNKKAVLWQHLLED